MIEFRDVSKTYPEQTKKAIDSLSLVVDSGSVCVLLGPSGCGKTTTLRSVNRMVDIDSGAILIDGKDITHEPREELRKRIGYVIQHVGLFPHLDVEHNISIVLKLLKWERARQSERVTELLNLIGLVPHKYRHKYPHELSGGEAQRIGVARALAAGQNIILMDEPFGAVDPLRRDVLQQEFLLLQKNLHKTVLFVTHDLDEAIRIGDVIIIMKEGSIVQSGTPEHILARPKNTFVKDFIGEDRALKRLSRFSIKDYLRTPHTISHASREKESARLDHNFTYWVTDDAHRIVGIIKHEDKQQEFISISYQAFTLRPHHTLRDALSRALGLGIDAVPIVDDEYRVIGEVLVTEIERVNRHGLAY